MATYAFNEAAKEEMKSTGKTRTDFFNSFLASEPEDPNRSAWKAAHSKSRGVKRADIVEFIEEINRLNIRVIGEPRDVHLEFARHTVVAKQNVAAGSQRDCSEETDETAGPVSDGRDPNALGSPSDFVEELDDTPPASRGTETVRVVAAKKDDLRFFSPTILPHRPQPIVSRRRIAFSLTCFVLVSLTAWLILSDDTSSVSVEPTSSVLSPSRSQNQSSWLAGSVVDRATNLPISGVCLTLVDIDNDQGQTPVCVTDEHGCFRFRNLPVNQERQVELVVNTPGYKVSRNHVWLGTQHFPVSIREEPFE